MEAARRYSELSTPATIQDYERGFGDNPKLGASEQERAQRVAYWMNRYIALVKNIEEGKVFKKDTVSRWACRNCGYVHEGAEAAKVCPVCAHPQAYFELEAANY